jgi:zeta-carotene desaturase
MWLGFLARRDSYEMGIPRVPLGSLYAPERWGALPNVRFQFRAPVTAVEHDGAEVQAVFAGGERWQAGHYVSALSFERLAALAGDLPAALGLDLRAFEHSPITGVHLWFDRPVTTLPHGTLLDRGIQWFYAREGGAYLKLVISASRSMIPLDRQQVLELCLQELREFLPGVQGASLVKGHVVKEVRATFSAKPGLESQRPTSVTRFPNLSLAGDWTRSGWPSTMEGAVRSGYLAAEAAAAALGRPGRFLLPDIA